VDGEEPGDEGRADEPDEELDGGDAGDGERVRPEVGHEVRPGRAPGEIGEGAEDGRGGPSGDDPRGGDARDAQVRGAVGEDDAEDGREHQRESDEDGRVGGQRPAGDGREDGEGRERPEFDHGGLDGGARADGEAGPGDVRGGPDGAVGQVEQAEDRDDPGLGSVEPQGVRDDRSPHRDRDAGRGGAAGEERPGGDHAGAQAAPHPHRGGVPREDPGFARGAERGGGDDERHGVQQRRHQVDFERPGGGEGGGAGDESGVEDRDESGGGAHGGGVAAADGAGGPGGGFGEAPEDEDGERERSDAEVERSDVDGHAVPGEPGDPGGGRDGGDGPFGAGLPPAEDDDHEDRREDHRGGPDGRG
jgi:hypothetical protein